MNPNEYPRYMSPQATRIVPLGTPHRPAQRSLGLQARGFRKPQRSIGNEHQPSAFKRREGQPLVFIYILKKQVIFSPWTKLHERYGCTCEGHS